ncbi:hypothetical protein Ahy_B03g066422 isoform C [Arachis hypogaea]|uniref:Uncharacterized protein n=1 Tax=Arachis hypogaea TaxID=3818 RepID=A0A445A404_ARAHY|nr:hypothetical protein Ahy_B03g066422 isoform C [Arachis hypogaea]
MIMDASMHVQYRSIRQTSLMPVRGNKEDACTGAKKKLGKINSLTGKGKENVANTVTSNPKCIEKGVTSGRMLKDLRTTECCRLQKGNAGSAALANKLNVEGNNTRVFDTEVSVGSIVVHFMEWKLNTVLMYLRMGEEVP